MEQNKEKPWYHFTAKGNIRAAVTVDGEFGWEVTSAQFKKDVADLGDIEELRVTISSPGGDVFEGMGMCEFIAGLPYRTVASIEGLAGSMASVFAMSFDEVQMTKGSLFFIHNARMMAMGDANDMRKAANDLDAISAPLFNYYKDRPGMKLSDEDLQDAMDVETFYTAQEALDAGFIDSIRAKKADLKAVASLNWYANYKDKLPHEFSAKVESQLKAKTQDGTAVKTTQGNEMTDEVTDSKAAVDQAVKDNDSKWVALLSHKNGGNIQAVLKVASKNLSAEDSSDMLDLATPVTASVEEKEEPVVEEKADPMARIEAMFEKVMTNADTNKVNMNSGTDDDVPAKKKVEDPVALFRTLTSGSREVV